MESGIPQTASAAAGQLAAAAQERDRRPRVSMNGRAPWPSAAARIPIPASGRSAVTARGASRGEDDGNRDRRRDLAREAARAGQPLPAEYHRLFRWWFILGWPAFAAMLVVFHLMIQKPQLW
ncbi:DUF2269 family protein [Lutibaculum baratangense]|uniref:Uncharacterized protein n=1 Tax=Lutibaculum baratangense AMV1 TaxID=631454 RepID=V4RIJ8_9HYPH|nr:DUF2269 family protein [Lutibaculum baratangense]ESR25911.1 hypothetical protein N177_1246 [Lutibaculum baratangense AMV1]